MKFKVPYTFSSLEILKKRARFITKRLKKKNKSKLKIYLEGAGINLSREEYLSVCYLNWIINFLILFLISFFTLLFLDTKRGYIYAFLISLLISSFIFFSQLTYPSVFNKRKQKEIERNLLPALEDMLVQINSGSTLFEAIVEISYGNYGALSDEFKKAVKMINGGEPESKALNEIARLNDSNYLRKTLWQLTNGIEGGSEMNIIIKESIKNLNEEQMIEMQKYSSSLNPVIVFYMLVGVIIPALSITFLIIVSSMINLDKITIRLLFFGLFFLDIFFQIMFIGLIKSRRPSLI